MRLLMNRQHSAIQRAIYDQFVVWESVTKKQEGIWIRIRKCSCIRPIVWTFPLLISLIFTYFLLLKITEQTTEQKKSSRLSVMKPALVGAAVALLCHRGALTSQCLPLGRCTLAYWRQTPWHTGGHLPEETSWGPSHNSDTWERTERKSECQRDAGRPREREIRIEGIMTDEERARSQWEITLRGCLESFVDLG